MLTLLFFLAFLLLCGLALFFFWLAYMRKPLSLERNLKNPLLRPIAEHTWESEAVFNPAAVVYGSRVHLFYRALGSDGISRIGYASSRDGIHFDERLPYPVYAAETVSEAKAHYPYTSPARLTYDTINHGSGGGWGGSEDPRAVVIEGKLYMTFNMFNGWESMRVGLTSLDAEKLALKEWIWKRFSYLSHHGERHKNWVLFPEKINGKFALFHNLYTDDVDRVQIEFFDDVETDEPLPRFESPDPQQMPDREVAWHTRTRSAGPPPLKTKYGWLVFYHAMQKDQQHRYKLGVLLLDLADPTKVLYRSSQPILSPDTWYENDWKPGIIYVSGAVILGRQLIVYYGGGDKYVAAATAELDDFINKLMRGDHATLKAAAL